MKIIIKCIIFVLIFIIIGQILGQVFIPRWSDIIDPATPRWAEFYSLDKDSIDALVIGASSVGRGYSPAIVWKNYGITTFNLGTSNQTIPLAYYVIKEAIKYQNPKVIVLDADAIFTNEDAPTGEYRKLFDNIKFDSVKIEALLDKNINAEKGILYKISYLFPLVPFHSRWNELKQNDFEKKLKKEYKSLSFAGMAVYKASKGYIDTNNYMSDKGEKIEIPEKNLNYIQKIIDVSREKDIKVLFIEIPCATSWSLAKHEATLKLAKEYEIEFIDYNIKSMQEEIGFNWNTDTADQGNHLNVSGAEKVSNHIGKILQEKYDLINKKEDKEISEAWKKLLKRYESIKR